MKRAVDLVAELSTGGRLAESVLLELTRLAITLDEAAVRAERESDSPGLDLSRLGHAHEAALSAFFSRLAEVLALRPDIRARQWLAGSGGGRLGGSPHGRAIDPSRRT